MLHDFFFWNRAVKDGYTAAGDMRLEQTFSTHQTGREGALHLSVDLEVTSASVKHTLVANDSVTLALDGVKDEMAKGRFKVNFPGPVDFVNKEGFTREKLPLESLEEASTA